MAGVKKEDDDDGGGQSLAAEDDLFAADSCEEGERSSQGGQTDSKPSCGNIHKAKKRVMVEKTEASPRRPNAFFTPCDIHVVADLYAKVQREKVLPLICVPEERRKSAPTSQSTDGGLGSRESDGEEELVSPEKKKKKLGFGLKTKKRVKALASSHSSSGSYDFESDDVAGNSLAIAAASVAPAPRQKRERKVQGNLDNVLSTMFRFGLLEADLQKTAKPNEGDDASAFSPPRSAESDSQQRGVKRSHSVSSEALAEGREQSTETDASTSPGHRVSDHRHQKQQPQPVVQVKKTGNPSAVWDFT